MKKSTRILILTAMALVISGGVFAYGKHGDWGFSAEDKVEFMNERITRKLDLSETQQQNLKGLSSDLLALMKEMHEEKNAHMAQIESMLQEPVLDQAKTLNLIETKTGRINNKAPAIVASLAVFLDSLSLEQKAQIQQFIEKRMHHRHDH